VIFSSPRRPGPTENGQFRSGRPKARVDIRAGISSSVAPVCPAALPRATVSSAPCRDSDFREDVSLPGAVEDIRRIATAVAEIPSRSHGVKWESARHAGLHGQVGAGRDGALAKSPTRSRDPSVIPVGRDHRFFRAHRRRSFRRHRRAGPPAPLRCRPSVVGTSSHQSPVFQYRPPRLSDRLGPPIL